MSAGSKIVPVRIPESLAAEMMWNLSARNNTTSREPWTLSDWIRHAIESECKHLARGRARKKAGSSRGESASVVVSREGSELSNGCVYKPGMESEGSGRYEWQGDFVFLRSPDCGIQQSCFGEDLGKSVE